MELENGKTPYSEGTFSCEDKPGCLYCIDSRCVYNVARIKIRISRACYEELLADERECEADCMQGIFW